LLEEIAHARGADADEHLDELGAADGEEGHAGLAGGGARQERLAGAGRSHEQDAFRQPAAKPAVVAWVLEEVDDLAQLFFGFVDAGDVGEVVLVASST
jgi:hypothetical protein